MRRHTTRQRAQSHGEGFRVVYESIPNKVVLARIREQCSVPSSTPWCDCIRNTNCSEEQNTEGMLSCVFLVTLNTSSEEVGQIMPFFFSLNLYGIVRFRDSNTLHHFRRTMMNPQRSSSAPVDFRTMRIPMPAD